MRKTLLLWALAAALLLAGCAEAVQTPPVDRKTPLPGEYDPLLLTPQPAAQEPPPGSPADFPPGVVAAQHILAATLGLPLEAVTVVRMEPVDWPDGCLGLGGVDEVCADAIVPGYAVTFQAIDQLYEYRTDQIGAVFRPEAAATQTAVMAARQAVAAKLGLGSPAEVLVIEAQEVEWSSNCLGLPPSQGVCSDEVTPGYWIVLAANGLRYIYHANLDGSRLLAAGVEEEDSGKSYILLIHAPETEDCAMLQVGLSAASSGECGGVLQAYAFQGPQRALELSTRINQYASFQTETPLGWITFQGRGERQPADEEARALAAWALAALSDARGESAPETGLLFTWQRSGGIAGLCETVKVYESGWAYAYDCKSEGASPLGSLHLTADQLVLLYNWVDRFGAVTASRSENVADGFQFDLTLAGRGEGQPSQADEESMYRYGADLLSMMKP
ncbi:MAG: hypothetical protein AB1453_08180 [Chloroflexota bacterium]|jgi:hypothetical protein